MCYGKTIAMRIKKIFSIVSLAALGIFAATYPAASHLKSLYTTEQSAVVRDRNGKEILIVPNAKGHYARFVSAPPAEFAELLIKKEDRFFPYHPGVNPLSIIRDGATYALS